LTGVGRPFKDIPADAPGAILAGYLRVVVDRTGMTTRQIGELSHTGHTTISQNLSGRLPSRWETVDTTIRAIYRALRVTDRDIGWSQDEVRAQARALWEHCRAYPPARPAAAGIVVELDLYPAPAVGHDAPARVIPLPRTGDGATRRTPELTMGRSPAEITTGRSPAEIVVELCEAAARTGTDLPELLRLMLDQRAGRCGAGQVARPGR
jgi:hypothetical protein